MKCPFCSAPLSEVRSATARIDVCPQCKGIWFDSGEFVDFVRTLTESREISPQTPQLFLTHEVRSLYKTKEKEKLCPRCRQTLERFNYAYDSNVFLDKCPKCLGLWADGGEVKAIACYLKGDPSVRAIAKEFVESDRQLKDLRELGAMLSMIVQTPLLALKIFIPLSDVNPRQKKPFLTAAMIVLCSLIFAFQKFFVTDLGSFFQQWGHVPAHFWSVGLVSAMFLHAGWVHLLGNMLFLWLFGDNVEDRFSRPGFLLFYLGSGLSAVSLYTLFHPYSWLPVIGASGAIAGIMGAYFVFYPRAKVRFFFVYRIIQLPAILYLGFWFLTQWFYSFLYETSGLGAVAWSAHVGGFLFGVVVACLKGRSRLGNGRRLFGDQDQHSGNNQKKRPEPSDKGEEKGKGTNPHQTGAGGPAFE